MHATIVQVRLSTKDHRHRHPRNSCGWVEHQAEAAVAAAGAKAKVPGQDASAKVANGAVADAAGRAGGELANS